MGIDRGRGRAELGRAEPGRAGPGRIFGRTDFRISQSKAKFDVEAHGEVRLPVHRLKPRENYKTKIFFTRKFSRKFFGGVEK